MTAQVQQSRAELLPCPFCGNPLPYVDDAGQVYEVQCGSCGGRGSISADYARAVADWNRRAPAVQAARAVPSSMTPLDPMHPPGLTSANAILSFNHGWRACLLAHGITKEKP